MRSIVPTCFLALTSALAASTSRAADAPEPPLPAAPAAEARIDSVLPRGDEALATDGLYLYRGSSRDRKWEAVRTPPDMPLSGAFVVPPERLAKGGVVLFCAAAPDEAVVIDDPKTGASHPVPADGPRGAVRCGLYRSEDGGRTWKLRSDAHDFQFVFWHPDGTLYALANKKGFVNPTHVYSSEDGGATWDDITHGLDKAGYGGLARIFADPDRPAGVCLEAEGVRGYVIRADDDTFRWHGMRLTEWEREHRTDAEFLGTNYGFTGIDRISDYQYVATFGNYFTHPFGGQTLIDAFELTTEKAEYAFPQHGPKPARVTMRFRPTDHPAVSFDLDGGGTDFWGLRLIDPAGRRTTVTARAAERAEKDKGAQAEYEGRKDIRRVELTSERPYSREVDLDRLFAFPATGVYRVQLVYENPWWASDGRSHWAGSFGGNVMTVTIR